MPEVPQPPWDILPSKGSRACVHVAFLAVLFSKPHLHSTKHRLHFNAALVSSDVLIPASFLMPLNRLGCSIPWTLPSFKVGKQKQMMESRFISKSHQLDFHTANTAHSQAIIYPSSRSMEKGGNSQILHPFYQTQRLFWLGRKWTHRLELEGAP